MTSANALTNSDFQLLILDRGQHQHRAALQKQSNHQLTSAKSLTNSDFQLVTLDRGRIAIVTNDQHLPTLQKTTQPAVDFGQLPHELRLPASDFRQGPSRDCNINNTRPHFKRQSNQQLTSANAFINSDFQLLILDRGQVAIVTNKQQRATLHKTNQPAVSKTKPDNRTVDFRIMASELAAPGISGDTQAAIGKSQFAKLTGTSAFWLHDWPPPLDNNCLQPSG